ncbi:hypothetical protein BS47DRAFT_1465878 [Hydnum rufescens UP504]|uniref:HNH nuclease domain-containing protein n=1 Tax=Hydnum rufescens UP504 TaxID=1448309 RepID=A0A9P6DW16_9AGAM|nr:hypothetical protein BS47DRAFT_1465878 [Hydnum rufescens UP504]
MFPHDRTPSNASPLTSLSSQEDDHSAYASFGSEATCISTRSRGFMNGVKKIMDSSMPLAQLVDQAQELVKMLSSSDQLNRLPPGAPECNLMLDRVLAAMLSSARACGGEGGMRYTASAIYACCYEDNEMTLRYLQSLGTTWVSHLLFVLTGLRDKSHPLFPTSQNQIKTNASHILRRAIAVYDAHDPDSRTSRSALVTLDILRHYASLPEKFVEEIGSIIDDPSNGMTLQYDAHVGFDDFRWSLRAVEGAPNTYRIIYHVGGIGHGLFLPHKEEITFVDSSPKFSQSSSPHKGQGSTRSGNADDEVQNVDQGIPLPDPLFFRIHDALARVLQMSGAAEAIDLVLRRLDIRKPGAILIGADFEDMWTHEMLRENIVSMLQMKVH